MIGEIERQFGVGWQSRISRSAREFHSVQFNLEPEEAAQVLAIEIDPDDLAAKGRERDPHVTVRFGFHEEVTPKDVEEIADGFIPVVATISDYEKFPEGPDGEPLVIRANELAGKLGGAHVVATIGDWRDGAENSTMLDFHHGTSEQLDYAAAKLGMEANQKQVLSFSRSHDGPDSIWNLTIPGTVDSVRQSLDAHGIDFRTLTIMPDKVGVTIFDQGTTLTDNVLGVAHDHQIDVERQRGSGKFLGGDTREAGRQVFAGIVDAYEKKHGVRSHHQGTRRPGRRGIGRSSEAQEVIQSKISVRLSDPVLRNYGAGWRARVSEEADT